MYDKELLLETLEQIHKLTKTIDDAMRMER